MNTIIIINAVIFAACVIVLWRYLVAALREQAKFKLFAVRDRLVLLVAQGVLKEDEPVFQYFYPRLNLLISQARGLDDILHNAFRQWKNQDDFKHMLWQTKREAKTLLNDSAFCHPEVCQAIEAYHQAVSASIITHSSLVRLVYLLVRYPHRHAYMAQMLRPLLPGRQNRALLALRYSDHQAKQARLRCSMP